MTNTNKIHKIRIYSQYPGDADNIQERRIISAERGDPGNADNIHDQNKIT